ncbi:ulp1 protease family, C-terminal catalytic domain-containing protein, partial [Tanacetum coccineum]
MLVLSPQPVSQYNSVTGQVVKESDTAPVVIEKLIGKPDVVKENPAVVKEKPVVVKEKPDVVKEKPAVVKEKPDVMKENPVVVKDCLKFKRKTDKAPDVIESDKHKADV